MKTRALRRRTDRREHHKLYEQWTGCPHRCACGRTCGWRPVGDPVLNPRLVRFGMTNGIVNRIRGYQRDGTDYLDHVGLIGLRHLPRNISRRKTLDLEAGYIDQLRPPFNIQHNPDHDTSDQELQRLRILQEPIPWQTHTGFYLERAGWLASRFALWVVFSAAGAALLTVAVAAL